MLVGESLTFGKHDLVPFISEAGALRYLSHPQASQELGCHFSEILRVPDESIQPKLRYNPRLLERDGVTCGILKSALERQLENIINHGTPLIAAIKKMGPEIGYGVFSLVEIPMHTVICLYGGDIELRGPITNQNSADIDFYTGNFRINASSSNRGIASYLQHLPASTQPFGGDPDHKIATTNVMPEFIIYKGRPIIAVVTLRRVEAGEMLGFSYGHYWDKRNTPMLFTRQGAKYPHQYSREEILAASQYDANSCVYELAAEQKQDAPPVSAASCSGFFGNAENSEDFFKVNIVSDDRKETFFTLLSNKKQDLMRLQSLIGSPEIRKQRYRNVMEIRASWLGTVFRENQSSAKELGLIFNIEGDSLATSICKFDHFSDATGLRSMPWC